MSNTPIQNTQNRNTQPAWLRSRRNRRLVVGVMATSIIWFAVLGLIPSAEWTGGRGYLILLPQMFGLLLAYFGWFKLRMATRGIMDMRDEQLDERMLQMRNQAYKHTFRICTIVITLILISYYSLIIFMPTMVQDASGVYVDVQIDYSVIHRHLLCVGMGVSIFMAFLPTMVYAWTKPDV